jgi:hypothetical protein
MIQYPRNHKINNFINRGGIKIKSRVCRHDGGSGMGQFEHILKMDGREWRFSNHHDQWFAFLEHDIGGAINQVVADAMCDTCQCTRGA